MEVWVIINKWVIRGEYHVAIYLYSSEEEAQREFSRMVENCKDFRKTGIATHKYEIGEDFDYLFSIHHSKDRNEYCEEFFLTDRTVK